MDRRVHTCMFHSGFSSAARASVKPSTAHYIKVVSALGMKKTMGKHHLIVNESLPWRRSMM